MMHKKKSISISNRLIMFL